MIINAILDVQWKQEVHKRLPGQLKHLLKRQYTFSP